MKTLTTCTLLVLVFAAAPAFLPRGQVAAESDTPELELERANTITVTGRSDLIVSADRATLSVDVRSESPSLGDARADYHRRVETLLRKARKLSESRRETCESKPTDTLGGTVGRAHTMWGAAS